MIYTGFSLEAWTPICRSCLEREFQDDALGFDSEMSKLTTSLAHMLSAGKAILACHMCEDPTLQS